MNFIDTIYSKIKQMGKHKFSFNDIAKHTGLQYGFDKRALSKTVDALVKDKRLIRYKNGEFSVNEQEKLLKCTLLGTSKDYAFAREINGSKDDDIFISNVNLNDACHGDTVMVQVGVSGKDRKYKRDMPFSGKGKREGRVVEILERGFKVVVGIMSISDRGVATVIPDDRRFTDSVFVAANDINGAENNQKVVLDILDYPSNLKMARGVVKEILGDPNDVRVTTLSIIRSFNLFEEFPEEVLKEAKKVSIPISEEKCDGRKDFRDRIIFTIDGDDAKDFDDAISLTVEDGVYNLGVYIADVSHYVKEGSKLDEEAFKRATSVYFPDHVLPMLPVELSNGICSLNPNEDRFVLAVEMKINTAGKILDYEINKGIIKSKYRMTYKKVTKILNGDKELTEQYKEIVPTIFEMNALAKILITRRDNAGQLDFNIPEPCIELNEDGTVKDIYKKPRDMSDRLIEQFMVLTNEVVARHFDKLNLPFVYRVHEVPVLLKVQKFRAFASSLGLKFTTQGTEPSPKDFQTLLKNSVNKDYSVALSKVMLRSMQKARYETENLGHFGLALKDYCHFTSPIRRYPDLVIHRIISDSITGNLDDKKLRKYEGFVNECAERSSTMERQAEEAERTVDAQKATEFMQTKIGEVYEGTISGVTENGIYVELENTIEGFIHIERLPDGRYEYDENHYMIRGNGKTYRLGNKNGIRVVSTDIVLRRIDFELANFHKEIIDDGERNRKTAVNISSGSNSGKEVRKFTTSDKGHKNSSGLQRKHKQEVRKFKTKNKNKSKNKSKKKGRRR